MAATSGRYSLPWQRLAVDNSKDDQVRARLVRGARGTWQGIVTENPGIKLQSRDSTTFQGERVCARRRSRTVTAPSGPTLRRAG